MWLVMTMSHSLAKEKKTSTKDQRAPADRGVPGAHDGVGGKQGCHVTVLESRDTHIATRKDQGSPTSPTRKTSARLLVVEYLAPMTGWEVREGCSLLLGGRLARTSGWEVRGDVVRNG